MKTVHTYYILKNKKEKSYYKETHHYNLDGVWTWKSISSEEDKTYASKFATIKSIPKELKKDYKIMKVVETQELKRVYRYV